MSADLQRQKEEEQLAHDQTYVSRVDVHLRPYTVEAYVREYTTPCYEDNGDPYGRVNGLFLERLQRVLSEYDPGTVRILDYACGMGKLSVYLALHGYQNVVGFDLSGEGVAFGRKLAEASGVADRVALAVMDAEALGYADKSFDVIIGMGVLHHTIKYRESAAELMGVLKPGGQALFKENLGDNPLLKVARFVTMNLLGKHGDVNLTTRMIRDYSRGFSQMEIEAWNLFGMAKRSLYRRGKQKRWRKALMRHLHRLDDLTVHRLPMGSRRLLCGESIITLTR